MKVIVQRVAKASVLVNDETIGSINKGLCLLVGIHQLSSEADADYLAYKIVHSRIFEDHQGKMNLSLLDVHGQILSISQFTLFANVHKGHRPSYNQAASGECASDLYHYFNQQLEKYGIEVQKGRFGENMQVLLINDGPVTITYDRLSKEIYHNEKN